MACEALRGKPTTRQAPELPDVTISTHHVFSASRWAEFGGDTPLTLTEAEVFRLRSLNDPIDLKEVRNIYLSISRLLNAHFEASRKLSAQRHTFLDPEHVKIPFIIGIAGPVSVGKSTTARLLKELLGRWPLAPKVELVTTDGFLWPNSIREAMGLGDRKGFPESYDTHSLLSFLSSIASGQRSVKAPVYSHLSYDIVAGEFVTIEQPDILIVEGINVLQVRDLPTDGRTVPFVSDFFDFSIYVDAPEAMIREWYLSRFLKLRETAFQDEQSYFHRYSALSEKEAMAIAERLWTDINLKNLRENIEPTKPRADLILRKGADHMMNEVRLRKL